MSSSDGHFKIPGGLRTQLLVSLAVLLLGALALVALAFVQLLERHVRQTEIDRTFQLADQLADQTTPHTSPKEPARDQLEQAVDRLMRHHPHVVGAAIVLGDKASGTPLTYSSGDVPGIDKTEGGRSYRMAMRDGERILVSRVQYRDGPGTPASDAPTARRATVARTLEPAFDRVRQMRNLLIGYLALVALFVLIVGYALLTYLVVRPIRAIGVATRRAARGDLASHIELQPPNEFGDVARSFNDMLDELRDNRQQLQARIDELDEAYNELEETQQNLIRSEKLASVGRLAAGVAHEIGNPLSAINGYLEMLNDEDLDPETRRDILERSQTQIQRIRTIIRDLLDFSRQDVETSAEPVDIADCITEAVDLVDPQPRARNIDIAVDVDEDLPPASADSAQLTQVIVNLLMNAADAIRDGLEGDPPAGDDSVGTIDIEAYATDTGEGMHDTVEIAVTDDGPGIPEDEQSDVFDPFFTTKEPGEGTGLGLAVSLRIVERFDGDIRVTSPLSDAEHGTRFTITLPSRGDAV